MNELVRHSDIEELDSKIRTLEDALRILAPDIDIHAGSLPRTADQARTMVNSRRLGRLKIIPEPALEEDTTQAKEALVSDYHRALQSMFELHLTPVEYYDRFEPDAPSVTSKGCKSIDDSGEPDFASLMANDQRSISERCMERHHFLTAFEDRNYPPPDLATSLIELYFQKVHPHEYVLHKGEFMQNYNNGLARTDFSFRALCYAVFAAASRFSSDFRTTPPTDHSNFDRQAAGALYGAASSVLITPFTLPFKLFDLQAMAVLSYFLIGTCSPMTAWFSVAKFLRRGSSAYHAWHLCRKSA